MKITALERIRRGSFPNLLWVRVYTDEGLKGLGEVHFGPGPVDTHIHDWAAQKLIGRNSAQVEAAQDALAFYLGSIASGAVRNAPFLSIIPVPAATICARPGASARRASPTTQASALMTSTSSSAAPMCTAVRAIAPDLMPR
jgi:hypothetical protein